MINVKLIKKPKATGTGGGTKRVAGGYVTGVADEARHAARADKAVYAEQAEYANRAGYASRAAFSDTAGNLTEDSPMREEFLSRKKDDTASGLITFVKGIVAKMASRFGKIVMGGADLGGAAPGEMDCDISSHDYSAGADGSGYSIYRRDGNSYLEIDHLLVRKKMTVPTLEILRKKYTGGNLTLGRACGTVWKAVPYGAGGVRYDFAIFVVGGRSIAVESGTNRVLGDSNARLYGSGGVKKYRLYFLRRDDEVVLKNEWAAGDMARVQEFNVESRAGAGFSNRSWWRLVTGAGQEEVDGVELNYIDVADTLVVSYHKEGGGYVWTYGNSMSTGETRVWGFDPTLNAPGSNRNIAPAAGDEVVQEGSVLDDDRRNLVTIDVSMESHGVSLYTGIGRDTSSAGRQYSLGKVKSRFGYVGGIEDARLTPRGYGVYTDNGYFRGEFVVSVERDGHVVEMGVTDAISLYVSDLEDGLSKAGVSVSDGTIDISGRNIIISNGGEPVAVFEDGKVKASLIAALEVVTEALKTGTIAARDGVIDNLTMTNATVTGVINAVSGIIGGFRVGDNSLTSAEEDSLARIIFNNDALGLRVELGNNVAAHDGAEVAFRVMSAPRNPPMDEHEPGRRQSVAGVFAAMNADNNDALYIYRGVVRGFRNHVRVVSESVTLDSMDTVVVANAKDISLTLPQDVEDGQVYQIVDGAVDPNGVGVSIRAPKSNLMYQDMSLNGRKAQTNAIYTNRENQKVVRLVYSQATNMWYSDFIKNN